MLQRSPPVEYRAINTIRSNLGYKVHIEKKESWKDSIRITTGETSGKRNKNYNPERVEFIDEKEFLHIQQFRKRDSTLSEFK